MIYTVTLNPALDCHLREGEELHQGQFAPGGKGVNVSRVLTTLGMDNRALGFIAGDKGRLLERILTDMGVATDFIPLPEGETRVNMKFCGPVEIERNGVGAPVPAEALARLIEQLDMLVTAEDTVCLCGSLPPGVPADVYGRLVCHLRQRGVSRIVVDTSGAALTAALPYGPWLIKPNQDELAVAVGRELPTTTDVMAAAEELRGLGAHNVLVSLGGAGAVLCTADGLRLHREAPPVQVMGTVGAGDSMVAGFVREYLLTEDWEAALRAGLICGSSTASAEGLCTAADVAKVAENTQ